MELIGHGKRGEQNREQETGAGEQGREADETPPRAGENSPRRHQEGANRQNAKRHHRCQHELTAARGIPVQTISNKKTCQNSGSQQPFEPRMASDADGIIYQLAHGDQPQLRIVLTSLSRSCPTPNSTFGRKSTIRYYSTEANLMGESCPHS